jgi:8-oxo-dGTP pyrophosphatase MutT (NUDIX family)
MKKAACVIIRDNNGLVLGVSRKDNHNDFGLVGGKHDDTDPNIEFTAIREAKEETGLDIYNLQLIDNSVWGGYQQHCFVAEYKGRIEYDEPHVVKWLTPEILLDGCFGEYNEMVFKMLGII